MTAATVAGVVAVTGAALAVAGPHRTPAPVASAAAAPRMFYVDRRAAPGQVREMLADGATRDARIQGALSFDRAVGLPDGRIVALGRGPGTALPLVVAAPDGSVRSVRDAGAPGRAVRLLGATDRVAWLWRPGGLYEHDLATGTEVRRMPMSQVEPLAADLVGDRLAVLDEPNRCTPAISDLTRGTRSTVRALPMCERADGMWLSPDHTRVAIAWTGLTDPDAEPVTHVSVLALAGGRQVADRVIGTPAGGPGPVLDAAWQDDRTLRVVVLPSASSQILTVD